MVEYDIPQQGDLIVYRTEEGSVRAEVHFEDDTFWLSDRRIAEPLDVRTVNEHFQNIYSSGELESSATIRKIRIMQKEGSRDLASDIACNNLDAISQSAGFKSKQT